MLSNLTPPPSHPYLESDILKNIITSLKQYKDLSHIIFDLQFSYVWRNKRVWGIKTFERKMYIKYYLH